MTVSTPPRVATDKLHKSWNYVVSNAKISISIRVQEEYISNFRLERHTAVELIWPVQHKILHLFQYLRCFCF